MKMCHSYTCQLSRLTPAGWKLRSHAGSRLQANFSRLIEKCELLPSCLLPYNDVGTISQTLWPMHSISDEQCVCVVYIKEIQNINFDKGEIA